MTEHSKIPLPENGGGETAGGGAGEGSLFERASGTFGLGGLRAAPVPSRLPEPAMKRARPVSRAADGAPPSAPSSPPASPPAAPEWPTAERRVARVSERTQVIEPAVRFGGPVHTIDRERLRDKGMIVPEGGATALVEEFRIVKRQLLATAQAAGTDAGRRILVCSPHPGEGKTFCSVNLAIAMAAERDREVLLVDADIAKPSVLSTLGLPKGPGLMDALADPQVRIEELVMATDIPGLWVLPAGQQTTADSEWLASHRTAEVFDRLTRSAPERMVVFDSPPALAASPAAELAKHVGQAVLVARAERTGRGALEDAIELLSGCADIKLLLNAASYSPSGRRFGTYYGYEG